MKMITINQASDYIIFRCKIQGDTDLSVLKHQKILYYVQAWYLAFYGVPAFDASFQAWIHGPVNREIYDLYKNKKYLYSEMNFEDIFIENIADTLDSEMKLHIDTILDSYAKFSAIELEIMTHKEDPWLEARKGYSSSQRCENIINNECMQRYYAARLS